MSITRWHKEEEKFYQVDLGKDLLGYWAVLCTWGSLNSRLGNKKTHAFEKKDEAIHFIKVLSKRRAKRGYREVFIH